MKTFEEDGVPLILEVMNAINLTLETYLSGPEINLLRNWNRMAHPIFEDETHIMLIKMEASFNYGRQFVPNIRHAFREIFK